MDTQQIQALVLAQGSGVTVRAVDAVVQHVQAHFAAESNPPPAEVAAYISRLPVWEKAGIAQELFEKLDPGTRLDLYRTHNPTPPPPVHSRRPVQGYRPTPEQQTELDAIPNILDRMTRYRAMRDQAALAAALAGAPDAT